MKKYTKLFSIISLASVALAASCSQSKTQQTEYLTNNAAKDKKIVFATAQPNSWPLMYALEKMIPLYNKEMKDQPGFLPIELQTKEITKADGEFGLATQTENYIKSNDSRLANLLLGSKTTAYIINKYQKLLDTSKELPISLFPKKILENHTSVVGEKLGSKLFNLPFDVSDTNGFILNIDLMNKMLDLMRQAGANIDRNGKLFDTLNEYKDKGNHIPDESVINFLKIKPDSLKGYAINSKTFQGVESLFELAHKFYDSVEIDNDKVAKFNKPIIPLQVFSIDYTLDEFYKVLNNRLKGKKLWQLNSTNGQYDQSKITFNLATDKKMQADFIDVFNEFVKNKLTIVQASNDKNVNDVLFRDVKFEGKSESSSSHMRQYQVIFSIFASVSYEYTFNSKTIRYFNKPTADVLAKWTSSDDVYLQQQVLKNKADDDFATYIEGGSSLVPISIDNGGDEDKATTMFINWLYNGKTTWNNKEINVRDLMTQLAAYVIPLNKDLERGISFYENAEKTLKDEIDANEAKLKNQPNKTLDDQTEELKTETHHLHSGALSFTSLKEFVDTDVAKLFDLPGNETTSKIDAVIKEALINSTLNKNPSFKTGQQVLDEVLQIISKNQ
ncbi:P68 family surface lipoprotein [Mycoplasma sp. 4423]